MNALLKWAGVLGLALCAGGISTTWGCRRPEPPRTPSGPSVRLYFMSTLAGALEPCGCRKDMLGGADHAAALLEQKRAEAPFELVLAAGPLLFADPELPRDRGDQDLWKARALASALADIGLDAWAPGVNDFSAGESALGELTRSTGAKLLAANLPNPSGLPLAATALFEVGPYRVGVVGIGARDAAEPASDVLARSLEAALAELRQAGAQIQVALVSTSRGAGLRLAEKVPGFDVILLGKAAERGDANDAAFPPALIGETLVVQAPNHLQALAYVDLFVVGDDFSFADTAGLERVERIDSLKRQTAELERRLASYQADPAFDPKELAAVIAQLARQRSEIEHLEADKAPSGPAQSSFQYRLVEVREGAGSSSKVSQRMSEYYRQVNQHNREAFKDRLPAQAPPGSSHYVGGAECTGCHASADRFWSSSQHATAYETLSREFKEFNLDCVGCHVTGYNRPGGSTVTHVEKLTDVQCEACHGAGSRHVESGGDTELITLAPAQSVCRSCHHAPHVVDDWDAAAALRKVVGPGHGLPLIPKPPPAATKP